MGMDGVESAVFAGFAGQWPGAGQRWIVDLKLILKVSRILGSRPKPQGFRQGRIAQLARAQL